MTFRSLIFIGLLMLGSASGADRPNVVIILADDLGRGDYSAFGTADISTPSIDRIAREGITFSNFYANSCVCSPTRAALLSGCYPDRVGVPGVIRHTPDNSWGWLVPETALLPRKLKDAGYHSALVGKWHLGLESPNTPTEHGFDHFHGFLGDMMDDYWTHLRGGQNFMRLGQDVIEPSGHATDLFTDWACEYLTQRAHQRDHADADSPFLLYLAYNAPHDPIQPPAEWIERVRKRVPGIADKRAALVALIEQMDAGIGRVLATLQQLGLAENTLVIFTSDNGGVLGHGAVNGPWRSEKQHLYEGGLRVPAMARWPGHIPPGSKTERVTLTMDIFATVLEVAAVDRPPDIDGVSFLSAVTDQRDAAIKRDLYFVRREGGSQYGGKTIEALLRDEWKLVQDSPFRPLELYNLKSDPQETDDLVNREPRIFNELSAALRRQIQRAGKTPWQKP